MKPQDLIKWSNINRLFGNQRSVITQKRLPKQGIKKEKINELLDFIDNWIDSINKLDKTLDN